MNTKRYLGGSLSHQGLFACVLVLALLMIGWTPTAVRHTASQQDGLISDLRKLKETSGPISRVRAYQYDFLIQGHVYEMTMGPDDRPVYGAEVTAYGSNNSSNPTETWLDSTTTDSEGWFGLYVPNGYEIYSIFLTMPSGYEPGAMPLTSDGEVMDMDWIRFFYPLEGQNLSGNMFRIFANLQSEGLADLLFVSADDWTLVEENTFLVIGYEVANYGESSSQDTFMIVGAEEPGWPEVGVDIPYLEPGETAWVEAGIDVPPSRRGTWNTFWAYLDPEDEIYEADEDNNLAYTSDIYISEDQIPDLAIWSAGDWDFAEENQYLVLYIEVGNEGAGWSPETYITVFSRVGNWQETEEWVPELAPGDSAWVEVWFEIPDDGRGTRPTFGTFVDPQNEIEEPNEDNNYGETPPIYIPGIEEPPRETAGPDLAVWSADNWEFEDENQVLVLYFEVGNEGDEWSPETYITVFSGVGNWQETEAWVPELAPDDSAWVEVRFEVPDDGRETEPIFGTWIDPQNEIEEPNEDNNYGETPPIYIGSVGGDSPPPPGPGPGPSNDYRPSGPNFDWVIPVAIGIGALIAAAVIITVIRRLPPRPRRPGKPPIIPMLPPIRLVRIWVTDGASGYGRLLKDNRQLKQGRPYTLHLQVTAREKGSQPRPGSRPSGPTTPLDVVFYHPAGALEMADRTATLDLPATGDSNEIRRPFTPQEDGDIRIRACIYYRNLLLQSAILEARVARLFARPRRGALARTIDYVASSRFFGLDQLPQPTLNIFTNQAANGTHWIGVYSNTAASPELRRGALFTFTPAQLTRLANRARQRLREIEGQRMYRLANPLPIDEKKLSRRERDICSLAIKGRELYHDLFYSQIDNLGAKLLQNIYEAQQQPGLISVARCSQENTTLPWAAVYALDLDVDSVEDIKLCEIFKSQVSKNQWSEDLSALVKKYDLLDKPQACRDLPRCPLKGEDDELTVCPYGFWGFMHQVEQPLQQVKPSPVSKVPPEVQNPLFDQAITVQHAGRQRGRMAVGAHPGLADAEAHHQELKALGAEHQLEVTYETKRRRVLNFLKQGEHHIYYLYCHGKKEEDVFKLQFGPKKGDCISAPALKPKNLKAQGQTHSLVFLNGCETMQLTPELIHGLLNAFKLLGASGVVGTEIPVYAELARPVALETLDHMLTGMSIGEAFLKTRRQLMRKCNPLGLIYSYYASANLHFHDEAGCSWCQTHAA